MREYAGRSNTAITVGRFRQGGQRRTTKLFSDAAPLTSPAAHQPRNPWTGLSQAENQVMIIRMDFPKSVEPGGMRLKGG
ncbi:hypothetical protein E2C01_076035 [Portunus trituberculatus]|uniref:Uncharacterized protein n=1 Tax=Portunus trituberculatus TaxID=210409 RepID=A0A5B7IHW1_PORTR|nr:hypothetical protein [Portunus trituberculatus]